MKGHLRENTLGYHFVPVDKIEEFDVDSKEYEDSRQNAELTQNQKTDILKKFLGKWGDYGMSYYDEIEKIVWEKID